MQVIEVKTKSEKYSINIERNIFSIIADYCLETFPNSKTVIVSDDNVYPLYGDNLRNLLKDRNIETETMVLPAGEETKSEKYLFQIYEKLASCKINRGDYIIALGGGVVGDITGYAAASFLRGVEYIQVPTTLLSQIDSSVGGKTGINLPQGKNLVGAFNQPRAVFIDPNLLDTLSDKYFKDGMAEMIKYACIKDSSMLDTIIANRGRKKIASVIDKLIFDCCTIKKDIVQLDEFDKGERMLLNFGHTIGHSLEKYFGYQKLSHGEAVAIGMGVITKRSEEYGETKKGSFDRMKIALENFDLLHQMPEVDIEKIIGYIANDKKIIGDTLNIVLIKKIGEGYTKAISPNEIEKYI